MTLSPTDLHIELVNRRTWASAPVLRAYGDDPSPRTDWWSDAGERAALMQVARVGRKGSILEIGVGGGRLVPILRMLGEQYVGVDYTPEMVELCLRHYPEVDVRIGDARDLMEFEAGSFDLVVFSFNGLDAIDHGDRIRALGEMRRVLKANGRLLYSTHNKAGPCFRATPWRRAGAPQRNSWPKGYRMVRFIAGVVGNPGSVPRSLWNWSKLRRLRKDEGSWAIGPVEAHDFDLLIHYVTLDGISAELTQSGFSLEVVLDAEHGRQRLPGSDNSDVRYFHVIASPAASGALS